MFALVITGLPSPFVYWGWTFSDAMYSVTLDWFRATLSPYGILPNIQRVKLLIRKVQKIVNNLCCNIYL